MAELVKSGKTRYTGLSNWSISRYNEAVCYCMEHNLPTPVSSQIQFSPARPNIEKIDSTLEIMKAEDFEYYSKTNTNVMAFSAQAKGHFSKLDAEVPLNPKYGFRYDNETNLKIYALLKEMSHKYECTVTELVTAVMTSNPAFPTIAILGCKNTSHIHTSIKGADIEIRPDDALKVFKMGLIVHN